MVYRVLQIKDIFVGSIDAKDDVSSSISENEFIESFIMPPNFEIDNFLYESKCFIEGYKGTGKTALLHYMSNKVIKENGNEMFILFKSHYKSVDKDKLENLMINTVEFDNTSLQNEMDFEYIWRWVLLNKIYELNVKSDFRVFLKNKEWDKFEKFIFTFRKQKNTKSFFDILPFKVSKIGSLGYSVQVGDPDVVHTLGLTEIKFEKNEKRQVDFTMILDTALELFGDLTMGVNNSYIFIDELEAFYEETDLFKRDLRMIRDLILTVKYYNDLFLENNFNKLKIICALRTEVLESIKKNVAAKEVNKVIYSFKKELKWNYSNTVAYQHPIIQIWLKRIKMAEIKHNRIELTDPEIKSKWFSEKVDSLDIIPYILDNSWHKPRDVVRFLQAASNSSSENTRYDQHVFSQLRKEYSKESWKEIFEELNVTYTPEQIELIRDFLTCFKRHFTFEEATLRAESLSLQAQNNFLRENIIQILKDLYRVGCIGNMSVDKRYYRWQHKGDDNLVIDDSKLFFVVHSGLWNELSLFYVYQSNNQTNKFEVGQIITCRVKGWNRCFVNVDIMDSNMVGSIHISKLLNKRKYIRNIGSLINMGDLFQAKVLGEDPIHGLNLERYWIDENLSNRT